MSSFSDLERAVLHAIFDESPSITSMLRQQLEAASVIARENTGGGFIITMEVPENVQKIGNCMVLGYQTEASIDGVAQGLGFALLMKEGKLHVLDGHSQGGENTAALNFERVGFSVGKMNLKD